jgi:hypothetical protein
MLVCVNWQRITDGSVCRIVSIFGVMDSRNFLGLLHDHDYDDYDEDDSDKGRVDERDM